MTIDIASAYLDTGQGGTGAATDDAAADLTTAQGFADGIVTKRIFFLSDYTQDVDSNDYFHEGWGQSTQFTGDPSFAVDRATFSNMQLLGQFDTAPSDAFYAIDCTMVSVQGLVRARRCRIFDDFLPVGNVILEDCHFAQESANIGDPVVIDLSQCDSMVMINCHGQVQFTNCNTGGKIFRVHGGDGEIGFASSCVTWGSFVVRGDWEIVERANGVNAPVTDYSGGRSRVNLRAQALANFAAKQRAAPLVVSGAQSISDTSIEVTTAVVGAIGDWIMVRNTGEVMLVTNLSGTTYTVTRGVLGSVAQPIANGELIVVAQPLADVVSLLNLLIGATVALLNDLTLRIQIVSDMTRVLVDGQEEFSTTMSAGVSAAATTLPLVGNPLAGGVVVGSMLTCFQTGESMRVTGGITTSSVDVARAQSGTTASPLLIGQGIVEVIDWNAKLTAIFAALADIDTDVGTLLGVPAALGSIDTTTNVVLNLVRALRAEASVVHSTTTASYSAVDTVIDLVSVADIAVGDWASIDGSGEIATVTNVDVGLLQVTLTRGQFGTTAATIANGATIFFLRRKDIIRKVLEFFVNNALTTVLGGGAREVEVYELDGVTVKNKVGISADGFTRTRII